MQQSAVSQFLIDPSVESLFDHLTKLATRVLGVPVSLVSIVEEHRQFFKSQCGLPEPWATRRETPLTHSFCQHVASTGAPFIVEDARIDPRVAGNLAVPEIGVIAYLGVPLADRQGNVYGAMCAIDTKPKPWTPTDVETMRTLAAQVMSEVELRTQLAAQQRQLAAAQAFEAERGQASRSDRHDLRTPLNAMLLSLEGVRLLGDLNEDQMISLTLAEKNGRQVAAMVDQMLDIGAIDVRGAAALNRQPVGSADLIARAIDQIASLAEEKKHSVAGHTETSLPVEVDGEKIVRVLVNLLANAVKFTPAGGQISVSAANNFESGHPVVRFRVEDSGIGMDEGAMRRIFTEGFRVDETAPTHRSTGIGLAFCKRVIEAHGGRIWAESTLGQGSKFYFTVPA